MRTVLLRVVSSGECISVKSEKTEGGVLKKRVLVLQEPGGDFENSFVVTVLGNTATLVFEKNDWVFVSLHFKAREYNGQMFQDIVAKEIIKK